MLRLTYAKPLSHNPTPLLRCITVGDAESVETRNKELVCKKTALTRTKQKKTFGPSQSLGLFEFFGLPAKNGRNRHITLVLAHGANLTFFARLQRRIPSICYGGIYSTRRKFRPFTLLSLQRLIPY